MKPFEDVSINVPKDAYDSLPSYMKALASWEVDIYFNHIKIGTNRLRFKILAFI